MAVVIEFPIVGLQCLDPERIGEALVRHKLSALRGKKRIVFANAAVIAVFLPIHRDIAE